MEKPIGLIAAMSQEAGALLRLITGWKPVAVGKLRGQCFATGGLSCVLVTSGIGARRAALAAAALLEAHSPGALVSFGIAGAVEAGLAIGDVVAPESVCRLEHGTPGPLRLLEPWPGAAREAATSALRKRGAHWFAGTAVTTPGSPVTPDQLGNLLHPVLEMETAGIAEVAAQAGIPLFSLRAVSDGPQAPLPVDLGKMVDQDANFRPAELLKEVLRHPGVLLGARRMLRNSAVAAANAALALVAALNVSTFG